MILSADRLFHALAVTSYGLASVHAVMVWRRGFGRGEWVNYLMLLVGVGWQTGALMARGFSLARCPVTNLFEALMFVGWAVGLAYLAVGWWKPLRLVGTLMAPALLVLGLFAMQPRFDAPGPEFDLEHAAVSLHVSLVLLAYAGFGFGCVIGGLYLIGDRPGDSPRLRALAGRLPSLAGLEQGLLRSLGIGLVLLTAGLVSSFGLMRERYGVVVRPDPKIAWSMLVWAVYLALMVHRLRFRGDTRRLAWGALGGFVFVMLTFWSTNLLSPIHHP